MFYVYAGGNKFGKEKGLIVNKPKKYSIQEKNVPKTIGFNKQYALKHKPKLQNLKTEMYI